MYRCCCHLHPRVDVKENTAGKHPDVARPEATSWPLPYFTLRTGEYIHWVFSHTVICLPRSSTYPPFFVFFLPIKQSLFKHFCTSSPSWVCQCENQGVKKFAEKLNPFKLKLYIYRQRHSVRVTFYTRSFTKEANRTCIRSQLRVSLCCEFISTSAHVNTFVLLCTHRNQRVYSRKFCIFTVKIHNNNLNWCIEGNDQIKYIFNDEKKSILFELIPFLLTDVWKSRHDGTITDSVEIIITPFSYLGEEKRPCAQYLENVQEKTDNLEPAVRSSFFPSRAYRSITRI